MPARSAQRRTSAPTMVGRAEELATLARTLAEAPAVAVVEGEAGVGKTRVVAELRARPELAGRRFVVGACRRIREPFPLGPLVEAVGDLREPLASASLSPVAGVLRPLLPELNPVLPAQPDALPDRSADRHRIFRAMAEVLGAVGPAVLVVEDAHWADEHSVEFLHFLLSNPPPALTLLLTFRGEEVDPGVRALTAALPVSVGHAHVVLTPLDRAQTGALAAGILGLERVSAEFAGYLRDRASGLPFVIEELLALMLARGLLARRNGEWVRRAIEELDVPAGVRDPVHERFSRLGPPARGVAEAAAVLQIPVPATVLAATTQPSGEHHWQGLTEALQSGLLVEHPGELVGFRHVLAAQAVYENIPGPRRRQLHVHAAEALAAREPVPLGQRAHHLRQAGEQAAWVQAAEAAADQALELRHDDEAVRLLEQVLRDAALPEAQRGRLAVKLARGAHHALHFGPDVVDLLAGVLAHPLPRGQRGELRLRLALLRERTGGDIREHRQLLVDAVPDLTEQPELRAHAMAGLGIPRLPEVPLAEYRQWLQRVLEVLPAVADSALQVSLLGKVAMVQVSIGDPQWRALTERILSRTGGTPREPAEQSAFHSVAASACYAGHLETADRLLTALQAGVSDVETGWREVTARATLALLDYCRGRWDGLVERAEALRDELVDHAPGRADVEVVAGCLILAQGDPDAAVTRLPALTDDLIGRGAYDALPIVAAAAIRQAVQYGDAAQALARTRSFLDTVESVPQLVSLAWAMPAVVSALVSGGQIAEARDLVKRWNEQRQDVDAPLAEPALATAEGMLAAADGRWADAASRHREAATGYERLACRYEAAQTRERAGVALLRSGETEAGTAELHAVLTEFQDLGAGWDLDRASQVARWYAVPVPTRHRQGRRGYGTALSPREREVAELAAQGRRDREIADALFLSTSTVRKHLSAAMRKLGVTSRVALTHQLGDHSSR